MAIDIENLHYQASEGLRRLLRECDSWLCWTATWEVLGLEGAGKWRRLIAARKAKVEDAFDTYNERTQAAIQSRGSEFVTDQLANAKAAEFGVNAWFRQEFHQRKLVSNVQKYASEAFKARGIEINLDSRHDVR